MAYSSILSEVRLSPLGTAATIGLLYQARMIDYGDCGAIRGIKIGRGNRSTRRKPAPVPLCPPQIPHYLTVARTRAAAVGSRRLTAWARPFVWLKDNTNAGILHLFLSSSYRNVIKYNTGLKSSRFVQLMKNITIFAWHCLPYKNFLTLLYKVVLCVSRLVFLASTILPFSVSRRTCSLTSLDAVPVLSSDCPHVSSPMLHTKLILITFGIWLYST
jgi:hypothetical protein